MPCHIKNNKIRLLVEETNTTFGIIMGGQTAANSDNTDHESAAAYSFIRTFRQILQKPDLSKAQLVSWLRKAQGGKDTRKVRHADRVLWRKFMAGYVTSNANSNA